MAPKRSQPGETFQKKKIASNDVELDEFLQEGEVLCDMSKTKWRLGRSIGSGGFGKIYLASQNVSKPVDESTKYVIKVEPHTNGPLFVEMHFYLRAAKIEMIDNWVARHELRNLGMPHYVGGGSHVANGKRYRFLILPRFGTNLHNILSQTGHCFSLKTALTVASYIIDILEYIHSFGYVHSDIKGSNLVLGLDNQAPIYLLDFGLSAKFKDSEGNHKPYLSDARIAHNGTLEFTSRDAHTGAHSRRGDLEILAFVLLQWLCGKLPWEENLSDPEQVANMKISAMSNIPKFLSQCFGSLKPPRAISEYLKYVARLSFEEKPNYKYCKRLFRKGVHEAGYVYDGKLSFEFNISKISRRRKCPQGNSEVENIPVKKKKKRIKSDLPPLLDRQLNSSQNINRITRHRKSKLRSREDFDWAKIIASNPEKKVNHTPPKKTRLASFSINPSAPDTAAKTQPSAFVLLDKIKKNLEELNPTPAMKHQINRIEQRLNENNPLFSSNKRTKIESTCNSSATENCSRNIAAVDVMNNPCTVEKNVTSTRKRSRPNRALPKKDNELLVTTVFSKRKLMNKNKSRISTRSMGRNMLQG